MSGQNVNSIKAKIVWKKIAFKIIIIFLKWILTKILLLTFILCPYLKLFILPFIVSFAQADRMLLLLLVFYCAVCCPLAPPKSIVSNFNFLWCSLVAVATVGSNQNSNKFLCKPTPAHLLFYVYTLYKFKFV